jgi:hypothetical protein
LCYETTTHFHSAHTSDHKEVLAKIAREKTIKHYETQRKKRSGHAKKIRYPAILNPVAGTANGDADI